MSIFALDKIVIDKDAPGPMYMQLYRELAKQVREHPPNVPAVLPSERTFCTALGLNRATVHRAYEEFIKAGVVERQPNKSLILLPRARKSLEHCVPAIGLLLPEFFSSYIERKHSTGIQYIKGIFDRAAALNYAVSVFQLPPPEATLEEMRSFIDTRLSVLSGIIHLGNRGQMNDPALLSIVSYTGIPQVCINSHTPENPNVGCICCDFKGAAEKLCRLMKKKKIRTCGVVSQHELPFEEHGSPNFRYLVETRPAQIAEYLTAGGITVPDDWNYAYLQNFDDFLERRKKGTLPDALWCVNDAMAAQLEEWCRKCGIKVPDELKIVGFDGSDHNSSLTTVRQPFSTLGALAVDTLLEHFEYGINQNNRFRCAEAELIQGKTL